MSEEILWSGRNKEGKIFSLYGNKEELNAWVAMLTKNHGMPEDENDEDFYEEYSLACCDKDTDGTRFTQEERDDNVNKLIEVIEAIENDGFMPFFLKCPRKKNGTLAKNRVTHLWRGTTFQHYWEDSYGFNAPELSIKNFDDYKAKLEVTNRTVGW